MNENKDIKPAEILSPAGDMERFLAAVNYGADAVYLAGKEFGMRASPANFDMENLKKAAEICHERNKKIYLTCNTLPRNNEIERIPEFLKQAADAGVDAFIIADLGVFDIAKRVAPNVDVHISTQTGVVNYETARSLYNMGASRVVLARELSLEEIATIRAKTNPNLEIETFVHGAMCMSYSGRCLISQYMTGRDANRGDCAQPCRWKYSLVEEKRKGEYFPVVEQENGTYFFNSKDLCMIEHIPELLKAGVTSLKIEGRAKSAYYVAVVTNAYKQALSDYYKMGENFKLEPWIKEEVYKISHRKYSTGFYFGGEPGQIYDNGGYVKDYEVVAVCENYKDGMIEISQRNKFLRGDELEVLMPGKNPFTFKVQKILDEKGAEMDCAPHAMQKLFIPFENKIEKGAYLRKIK